MNEQPAAEGSAVEFFCFSDRPGPAPRPWQIVRLDPILPMDPVRSSRYVKILPHLFLEDYAASLYIDTRVILKMPPERIYSELLSDEAIGMVCFQHSFRETVLDEFAEVRRLEFDDPAVIEQQLQAYRLTRPEVLCEKPVNGGFLLRRHDPAVMRLMLHWAAHMLRYSRRDQLSFNYVAWNSQARIRALDLDIRDSAYCAVLPPSDAAQEQRRWTAPSGSPATSPAHTDSGEALMKRLRETELELQDIHDSRLWRLVQVFSSIRRYWRRGTA